ncbi:hypothetical protein C6Y39_04070 [Alteromonas gracilis]|uniref:Cardiolipin synthase N-terminal domain-containing protein n=1 Tax=Alteromonas gracilis TaxID=1479524 RepID=A0ABX5CUB9_9ALTE|nr:hypothetical protein C6Y39_04070 [Alteromonas gracilis]
MFTYIVLSLILLCWIIPITLIIKSKKTNGSEKLGWILAMLFISWVAWIFYLLFAPLNARQNTNGR